MKSLGNHLKSLPKKWPLGVAGAIGSGIIVGCITQTTLQGVLESAAAAGITSFLTIFFVARHDARLARRQKGDKPFAWDVWMNSVKVGCITDAQYAAIQRAAFGDGRLVVAQALNLGRVALNIVGELLVKVPLLLFWLLVLTTIISPESITEIAEAWRTVEPDQLTAGVVILARLGVVAASLLLLIQLAIGGRFGFRNHYSQEVARQIRQQCNTPTEGDIHLSMVDMNADYVVRS